MCVCEGERERESMRVCDTERERECEEERVCVSVCMFVCRDIITLFWPGINSRTLAKWATYRVVMKY